MVSRSPGTTVREDEIYRAHFDDASVLNTIFDSQPAELRRPCHFVPGLCLP